MTTSAAGAAFVVDAAGARLHAREDGHPDAPAILLCGSLGTNLDLWDPQVAELASDHRVLRFDTRGHGRSGVPDGDYDLAALGRDALAVLDAAGVEEALVVGVSLGGLVGLWLAVHAQQRVRGLVAANTAARIGSPEGWEERIRAVRAGGMEAVRAPVEQRFFSAAFRGARPDVVEAVLTVLTATSPTGYAGCCAALRDADLRSAVGGIAVPTLVIGGTRDEATDLGEARRLAAAVPGARLTVLEAGHLAHVEVPEDFTAAVRSWLRGS